MLSGACVDVENLKKTSMMYLLSDVEDQSIYMTGQFFRDSAINPCIESSYRFVEYLMQQVISMHKASLRCVYAGFIYLFISLIHQQSYQTVAAKGIRHADGKARPTGTYSFPDKLSLKTNTYSLQTTTTGK